MAKWGDGPGWTIDQAMQVLTVLHPGFRENGYALAMHGSVSRDGKGNDLDLIAVPEELCMTPPEEMERMMCDLIGAQPAQQEPNRGLLGTWSRACVLEDGRGIDMEYRLPAPIDRRHDGLRRSLRYSETTAITSNFSRSQNDLRQTTST